MNTKQKLITAIVSLIVIFIGCAVGVAMLMHKPERLPVLFDAPAFALVDQDGKPFTNESLRGKVWVADFVFTQCTGICPLMTRRMAAFQQQTVGSPVQIVSFSVDPENDTPAVLKGYAKEINADETRWHFLTGTRAQTWEISKGMMLAVGQDKGNQVLHSSKLILIDNNGHVRGLYDTNASDFDVKKLADDSAFLLKQ